MQFYRITHPDGRLEFSTVGTEATKRAKEIGGTSEPIEVDTNKQGLLKFFNELAGSAPTPDEPAASEPVDEPIHHSHTGKETACPKCKWTPRMAEGYVASVKRRLTVEGMKEWINEREGWELSTIVAEITDRLCDLVAISTGKKGA